MFYKIGDKLQRLAKGFFVLGFAISIGSALIIYTVGKVESSIVTLIGGVLATVLSTFVLYGFGHLIETADEMNERIEDVKNLLIKQNKLLSDHLGENKKDAE